jgi:hypothetical protein
LWHVCRLQCTCELPFASSNYFQLQIFSCQ